MKDKFIMNQNRITEKMAINWYMNLYYKYRDYPVNYINLKYKPNELKNIYASIFARLSLYFHISINNQFSDMSLSVADGQVQQIKSNKRTVYNYSSACVSLNSKYFQSHKKMNAKLKNNIMKFNLQSNEDGCKSYASINLMKGQDSPIDEFEQQRLQNLSNFLKLVLNTGKQFINNILIQGQSIEQQSCEDISCEDSSEKKKAENYQQQDKKILKQQIYIQTIPDNNEEINFYFLEFCSNIDVKRQVSLGNSLVKSKLHAHFDDNSSASQKSQMSLKEIIKTSHPNIDNSNLDYILTSILSKQLLFANNYLSKFQSFDINQQKKTNKTGSSSHINLIIQTWLELITMIEDQNVIYEITSQLVKGSSQPFIEKISSYLYFISLVSTKSLLAKSVSKQNFLELIPDLLQGSRSLNDLKLEKKQGFVRVFDIPFDRPIYSDQALNSSIRRWKHVGRVVSRQLLKNPQIFWAKGFQQCCELLDKYLQQKVQFSYSMLILYQKLRQQDENKAFVSGLDRILQYQRAIKLIIQREVGNNNAENILSRGNLKSKPNINRIQTNSYYRKNSFIWDEYDFIFYDEQVADRESKIYQIKQWEKVVRSSIAKLRGYRKILQTGLYLFDGIPQLITSFFLETYLNFKKIQVVTSIDFYETVHHYCHKIETASLLRTQKLAKSNSQVKQLLAQLDIHKQNHRQLCRQMTLTFRSRQMSSKTINTGVMSTPQSQTTVHVNSANGHISGNETQRQPASSTGNSFKGFEGQKNYDQSGQDQIVANSEFMENDNIPVLEHQFIISLLQRIKFLECMEIQPNNSEDISVLNQVNNYLKAINQCNFILSLIQTSSSAVPGRRSAEKGLNNSKNLFLLTSWELVESLSKHQTDTKPNIQSHNHRKISNQNKINRMSSSTLANRKKNSIVNHEKEKQKQKETMKFNPTETITEAEGGGFFQHDLSKIREKIVLHNQCLNLVVLSYCKHMHFYRLLLTSIQCQKCCGLYQQVQQNAIPNFSNKQQSKQKKYQRLASKKIYQSLCRYQKIFRPGSEMQLQEFKKQMIQQMEQYNLNNEIIMIFMFMASLHIDNETFLSIYKQDLISEEKASKVKVIGRAYYQSIHSLYVNSHGYVCDNHVSNQSIEKKKNTYLQNLLVLVVAFLQFLYNRVEDRADLSPYTTLFMNYFISKASLASQNEKYKQIQQLISISKIISQSFDWNEQNRPEIGEKQLILQLLQLRTLPASQTFAKELRFLIQKQFKILSKYQNSTQKVQYLQKKLLYCMLRQIYFDSYYDIGIFEAKSNQARKNFAMYESMMTNFLDEIIEKDHQQFLQKKTEQLKQRSAHLKGYLLDYQKQPDRQIQYKNCLIKIVCIFDKTLNLLTQNKEFQMKKRGSNSISLHRKNRVRVEPIYMHFVSTQYTKPNRDRVKVFDNEGYYFYRAIQIYEDMLSKKVQDSEKKYSIHREFGFNLPLSIYISYNESEYDMINQSKESLLALWINHQYKNLHQNKMLLSHQNYLSKIEKLYIDLDVRHKVFESFKDKILNYEMQKTKIYHQYMDYIRGLKFDVYSHVTNQDPLPYFKLINGIKLYRLNIKKKQLQQKIDEEFGKNLGKWNQGIASDMKQYSQWVSNEMKVWQKLSEGSKKHRKQLFEIYSIVSKQLKRQSKTIQMTSKSKQNITSKPSSKVINIRKMVNK